MAITDEDGPWNLFSSNSSESNPDLEPTADAAPTPAPRRSAFAWSPDVDDALEQAAQEHGVDRGLLDTFARIESSGRADARTGSYKGLFQLSDDEFFKHGGQSNPFDPHENARAGASKIRAEKADFAKRYGREPSAAELYMIHQQGVGGAAAHWANPDAPAWQNMYSTGEGRQKGANWARRAIWGNVPDDVKRQYGSVDNITSRDFVKLWEDKVARFGSGSTSGSFPVASGPAVASAKRPAGMMSLGAPVSEDDDEETEEKNPLVSTSYDEAEDDEVSPDPEAGDDSGPMYLGGPNDKTPPWELFKNGGSKGAPAEFKTQKGTEEPWTMFGKGAKAALEPAPKDGVGDGIWENVKNPQQYAEIVKGVIPGAISMQGTALQAPDVLAAQAQYGARDFGAKQLAVMDRIDRGEAVPETEDAFGYQHMSPEDRAKARKDTMDAQAAFNPTPIQDRTLYKAGEAVQEFSKNLFPAAPGYEQSVGRQLGEGLGSMVGGMPYGMFGTAPAAIFFSAAGAGEATQRAIEFDKKERKEGREGLSQEQIALAGIAGVAPGATDLLPLETLLGRIPLPVPAAARGPLAQAIGRIGGQAFVEGLQEGGQQFLQNLIAREVYNPKQDLGDEVLGNTGVGAGVGGLAQTGKELGAGLLKFAGGRRARHAGNAPEAGESEDQKALPAPPKQITGPQGEQPEQPAQPAQPDQAAQEAMPPPASAEESGWLRARGFDDKSIAEMSPDERAAEIEEAKAQGLKPVAGAAPKLAPDDPTAEPVSDLLAQARDLSDPKSEREGLYIPVAGLEALDDKGAESIAQAIDGRFLLENFDDKGGLLAVSDYETAKKALEAKAAGEDLQKIIGEATGAGSGKPADGSIVVQQRNKDGAVTRETLVTPDKVDATAKSFARAGHEVEVMSPQEALQRREDLIAQQRVPAREQSAAKQANVPAQEQGTRDAPVAIEKPEDVAAVVAPSDYSPAQGEANNRRLGHAKWNGLDISIETDGDNVRRGQTKEGREWKSRMGAPYGYFKNTLGADDMHVDVFVGPNPASDKVYVLDENDKKTGKFRQHKTFIGFDSEADARQAYASSSNKSEDQIGGITEMGVDEFKEWLADGKKTKPVAQDGGDKPRKWDGPELSDDEIDLIVTNWKFVRDVAAMPRPQTLTQFVIAHGGLQDGAREVRHIMGAAKERPGLVNQNGVTLDDMALKAWESGFFEDGERPTIADFLNKLQDDLHTGAEVRLIDQDALDSIKIAGEIAEELNDYGITASKFRSEASLREYFGQARPKAAGKAEDTEGQEATGSESADAAGDRVDEVPFGSEPEGQQGPVARDEAGDGERAGAVRDREDQDQQGAEPAARARDSGEDRGPAGDGQAGRGSGVDGARESGPSDSDLKEAHRWWRYDLTPAGRQLAAQDAGLKKNRHKVAWQHLTDEERAALAKTYAESYKPKAEEAAPEITTEASGQTSIIPEATTKEKIAAEAKAKERKGGNEPMDVGMFGSEKDQTDLVDMAKAPKDEKEAYDPWKGERPDKPDFDFIPNSGWRDHLFRARVYANALRIDHNGKSLEELVKAIDDATAAHAGVPDGVKVWMSDSTLDDEEARMKGGEYHAYASREKPYSVVDGYGATPNAAMRDAVAKLKPAKPSRLGQGLGDLMGKSGGQAKAVETVAAGAKAPAETATPRTEEKSRTPLLIGRGDILTSKSGRELSPVPNVSTKSVKSTNSSIRDINAWLKTEALAEIEAEPAGRKDILGEDSSKKFRRSIVEAIDAGKASQSDQDTLNEIVFGDPMGPTEDNLVRRGDSLDALVVVLRGAGFKTILEARKFAREAKIVPDGATNKQIDEAVEQAVVVAARQIVEEGKAPAETYQALVDLYGRQPNLASRTGTSVANQAYSTPMPLAYLASRLASVRSADVVYEPTAGNGALLMEAGPGNDAVYANEIDPARAKALSDLGFTVSEEDAGKPRKIEQPADAIVANPPFGAVKEGGKSRTFKVDGWSTTQIDHAVSLNALDNLTPDGKAVLILGGTKSEAIAERRKDYRGKAKREFYARLYKDYNVTDHFTVSGDLYTKQGASWPVDVIVIDGRGQSERKLPAAQPPVILKTWDQVAEKLPNGEAGRNELAARAVDRQAGKPAVAGAEPAGRDGSDRAAPVGRGSERVQPEGEGKPAAVRAERAQGKPADVGRGSGNVAAEPAISRDGGRTDQPVAAQPVRPRVKREAPKGGQAFYEPTSTAASLDTLIPVNMAAAAREAMAKVEERRGSVDELVADRLGYDPKELSQYFSAEQVDALAAAIDNVERGAAMIVGDQTGIGKGRIAAGMLRYAMKKGMVPVFLTEKPDLYGDIYRDLRDIGVPEMLDREPRMFITNAGETITLDEEALAWKQESEEARRNGEPAPKKRGKFLTGGTAAKVQEGMKKIAKGEDIADVVFTTYDQLNTVKGQDTPRRKFLAQIAPQAMIVMDEAHNAGGQAKTGWENKNAPMNRADFARELAAKAKGVMFSSATYAKRPDVMDLYARTDMGKAVDEPSELGALIQHGGVPMQQIVASMLAKSGQYLRRERSFDGVDYQLTPVPVDLKAYKQFSASMQAIFRFDLAVEEFRGEWGQDKLDEMGFSKSRDDGVGGGSASSVAFGSLMHNITNQMLLAIKAEATAQQAIKAHKAGEKPVIALANTNESFIKDFAEDEGIKTGDPLDLDFSAVLQRYLDRTLRITVKGPSKERVHLQIPVDDLPMSLRQEFRAAMSAIKDGDYSSLPISPIDWIRYRLGEAGMSVKEVTGRQTMIDYSKPTPTYVQRPKSEQGASGKRGSIAYFNAGKLDALILNRSGSTGVSMHASSSFKDKRKRRMILAQAEGNIDTHLQMLGRVHRTGQVITPAYAQIAAEIPAEARPTAVLMKKMASLNANTTGARSSAFTVDSVDFINEVGDKVVADILMEDPDLNVMLGEPLKFDEKGKAGTEEISRKATGRLVLLDPDVQSRFLDQVQKAYLAEIEQLDALGENPLEAKTVDLQAKTIESSELKPKQGDSPFLDAVRMEKVSAKAQGRAMPPSEVASKIADFLKTPKTSGSDAQVLASLEAQGRAWGYKETERVSALIRKQMAEEIAETGADAKESTRRRLEAQFSRWNETMGLVYPGARVRLGMQAGDLDAIVMSVERTGKAKQMGALSSWTVKFAVPDSMRQLDFPMSKLFPPSVTKAEDEKGSTLTRAGASHNDLVDAFEQARKEGRETRFIMTGNILGGFDQTRGRGRIVNFTDEKGELRPGILMGREFSAEKFMDSRAVRFQNAGQIVEFMDKAPLANVSASQGAIELSQFRSTYRIEMSSARAKAGQFFTDAAVRKAIAPKEFEKRGPKMFVEDLGRAEFTKAVAEMQKIGAKFEVRDQQDLAQSIVSKPIASALRAAVDRLPSGNFKSAIPDIRQAMGSVLKAGRPVAVNREVVDAVHSAVGAASRMVPNGTRVFALTRVEPTGQGDKVIAIFEDREGYETKIKFPWASLSGMRAFYLNGHVHIVRLNARSLRAAGEFDSHVTAELGHEVIHALRRGNVLVGATWDRLLGHAKTLRLLDGDFGTYAKTVGDLSANMVPDVTVREVYEQFYNTRADRSEMMDEEEVAHMMEWYLRGILSPAEIAPVRDLLDAIERGEVADISPESQLEAEMVFAVSQVAQAQRRELDRLGFYSKALEAAKDLRQAKGTPEQMLAMLIGHARGLDDRKKAAVSKDLSEAINIVNRVAGRDVEVRFSETMDLASVSPEQIQATERAGIAAEVRGSYRRPTLDARAIITLATGKDDLLTTAGHEAWHHVEETLASEAEKRLLKAPSEMRRMRAQVADEIGMDRADPRLEQIPASEIRAIAFQKYRREREEGQQPQGIHMGVRRFFDRMLKILAVVRNALAGHGLNTYEDVFEAARTGEIAQRQAENPSPAAKNDGMFRQDEAIAAPQDVNDVMASLIPRVIQQSVARTMRRFEVGERVDRLRVGIQDKFLPVRRIQEEKERQTGTRIPINLDTYVAEALFHGRAGEQTADLKTDYIEPMVEILRKAEISKEQFDDYLYARHAQERNSEIAKINPGLTSGSGMTDAEANAILAGARGKQAAYDQASKLVDAMIEETRKRLLRSGLISRETFDTWSAKFASYVPLRGFEAGQDEADRPRSGRGFDIRGPEAMQALGRRSKADSPLAYALMQAQQAIIRAEKNRVDKTLYRFIQTYPDHSLYQIYRGEYRRRLNPVTKQVESYWVPPQFVRDDAIHGVKIGGKQYYMELKDPGLARAMRGVQGEQHNAVLRGMMWLSRTYATLLTSYNPEFVVSNFLRDIQTALANVTDVADKPAGVRRQMLKDAVSLKSVRGVINALRGDGNAEYARWFEEYRQAGGKISFMEFNDVERIQKDVTKSIARGRFRRATSKALDLVNDLNTAVENGVRLSTYIAMRKAGIGQDRAAFVARELTVNFNRKGEWSPIINSMYLFFNASVQGTTRMVQAIAKSRTLQVGVASIMGAAFMVDWWNYLVAGDDDDGKNRYDKIPAWIKERNLIVMTGRADGSYIQIPMPYGYNLFWLGGQQTAAVIRGASKPHEAALTMGKAMFEVMSPIGGANGSFAQMAAPTMVDPFIQVIENKTWYGGPIYPTKYNKNLPDSENAFSSVNPWFQAMARKLNSLDIPVAGAMAQAIGFQAGNTARKGTIDISPEVIEHFFEFAGGGLAKFINNAATAGSRVIHGDEWLPEKTPFVRRIYGKATTESRRRDFYAAWEEVDAAKFEIDNLIKNTRKGTAGQDEIAAAREKHGVELQAYGFMRDTQRALSAMRKERTTIELNDKLSRPEREEKLKEIQNRENGLILRSLGSLNRLKKQSKQPPQAEAAE